MLIPPEGLLLFPDFRTVLGATPFHVRRDEPPTRQSQPSHPTSGKTHRFDRQGAFHPPLRAHCFDKVIIRDVWVGPIASCCDSLRIGLPEPSIPPPPDSLYCYFRIPEMKRNCQEKNPASEIFFLFDFKAFCTQKTADSRRLSHIRAPCFRTFMVGDLELRMTRRCWVDSICLWHGDDYGPHRWVVTQSSPVTALSVGAARPMFSSRAVKPESGNER